LRESHVVVLAYNHWADTKECLDSLLGSPTESLKILVVDNGSTDGTREHILAGYPSVELMTLPANVGINRGYNVGMQRALDEGAEYVAVMNNDTSADSRMFTELRAVLDADPQVGLVIPKIVYHSDPRRIWSAGAYWRSFPPGSKSIGLGELDGPKFAQLREVELATSCCMLIRAEALRRVGLFDASYGFYYSDWDLSTRLWRQGYKIMYVPQARLRHKVSVSTQKADRSGYWSNVLGRDSVFFYLRYIGWTALPMMTAWIVLRDLLTGQWQEIVPYLRGVAQGWQEIRQRGAW